ncbi:DUF4198 domain-containing protein [Undibacterium sp. RTI2.1]|uniref:DUF4198 domain-containing protein n=1 Tax=unclassified Undibacterium TaxID=2630295 RepID=UPI002AB5B2D9|nr:MULTISPECIES: DUF4198 domain-containing protein [unclassified Undibacterium]MDY7539566.1 DUF4198 domain-containing protein [Undibacterium sp. 5I1]MEB0030131.1 DUF4198 domain-containing protein [Undibacterium sp. RTI2.1]MEB0116659.1 DUF4198 domain-containing protein [Undibacterium sp. RTI2.2]MEB0230484.1 DUF4198 domain-containing protein [Undibacterium sp. 10I3]MEB0258454.1 DUF4198 domain-containing protein [Undibacterium sp. 5I1]
MKPATKIIALSLASLALSLPLAAQAHRAFLLPTSTITAGNAPWVSIDAAAATDVFFMDHQPLKLDSLLITAPDGSNAKEENANTGKLRSSFDLHLEKIGTYKISLLNNAVFASYKDKGVPKRWRGAAENISKEIPADAEDVVISQMQGRIETFVTNGKPSTKALEVTGKGLEMQAITHPNDLVAGENASFRLVLDGKPAANVSVSVIPGGIRYRQNLGEQTLTTDADGKLTITWKTAGMYWLEASVKDDKSTVKGAKERRANYSATLEVLPQ